jgi:hypothetical protein
MRFTDRIEGSAMRRPLDWIVVSILLLVLSANRVLTSGPPRLQAGEPDIQAMVAKADVAVPASPFAWIEEDGSLVYLPVPDARDDDPAGTAHENPVAARQGTSASNALYTWSSPMAAIEQTRAPFQ